MSKLLIKIIMFVCIVILFGVVRGSFEPLVTADVSIQAQLSDSDSAMAGFNIYKQLLNWSWLLLIAVAYFIFRKDVKKAMGKGDKDNEDN